MDTAMTEDMGFLGMMQSLDAFFPVGAFTLSNGLEDYVLRDRIQNGKDLENYIQGFLQIFPYSDLGIVSLAYRNARSREAILELDAVGTVMKGASEVRNGSIRMGRRYMKARAAIGDSGEMLAWYRLTVSWIFRKVKENKKERQHIVSVSVPLMFFYFLFQFKEFSDSFLHIRVIPVFYD